MEHKPKIIIIVGTTSSGKSDLAVYIAKKINGEVISADSRQIYKGLNIGTGKITKTQMKGVPHHLLDVASPKTIFTAAHFVTHGTRTIKDIIARGKIPIIAGGTGFYIDALVGNISLPEVLPDTKLRKRLEKKSSTALYATVQKKDPARATTIQKDNKRRLIRALEIIATEGSVPAPTKIPSPYDILWIGIKVDKNTLRTKIQKRNEAMLKKGLVAEVKALRSKGISWKRVGAFGFEYKYIADYIRGKIIKDYALERMNIESAQYAKRQRTYWKRNTKIQWFENSQFEKVLRAVRKFI